MSWPNDSGSLKILILFCANCYVILPLPPRIKRFYGKVTSQVNENNKCWLHDVILVCFTACSIS